MIRSIGSKNVLWLAIIAIIAVSCKTEEDAIKQTGQVEFVFSALDNSGSRELEDVPVTAVLLSIEDASGNSIYHLEEVELYQLNGQYVSKPLALEEGEYKLTEFMVVDQSKEIKFVTPIADSKKAYLVETSLPLAFGVNKDKVGKLAVEVLDIAESSPADFGYTTFFDFSVVEIFDFLIGVFVFNADVDNYELTAADIQVSHGDEILYEGSVEAVTNTITLREGYDSYKLLIEKEGYQAYEETFTGETLKLHYDSADLGPLVVTLVGEEKTITLQPDSVEGKDAVTSYISSNKNYGNASDLHVYSGTVSGEYNRGRAFIEFDLSDIPANAEIVEAKLSLYYNSISIYTNPEGKIEHYGDNVLYVRRVTSAWEESTITKNNQPTTTTLNQVEIPKFTTKTQDYTDINVTTLVQDIVNDPDNSHGFMIRNKTEEPHRLTFFASSDHPDASKHPRLVVTYK